MLCIRIFIEDKQSTEGLELFSNIFQNRTNFAFDVFIG